MQRYLPHLLYLCSRLLEAGSRAGALMTTLQHTDDWKEEILHLTMLHTSQPYDIVGLTTASKVPHHSTRYVAMEFPTFDNERRLDSSWVTRKAGQ